MPCCVLAAAVFGVLLRRRARKAQQAGGRAPVATWSYEDGPTSGVRATATAASATGGA